ncbi:MAG TPA: DUF5666 domain-containing protein [Bryobacteraceae bacterium]|nr:DUF5666 domain-containing protein [Bryobacteraceae bacterium]
MTRPKTWMVAVSVALLASAVCVPKLRANDPDSLAPGALVPVSDLNIPTGTPAGQPLGPAFVPTGSDPLQSGTAHLSSDGTLHVDLDGAGPNQAYTAYFCRFGFGPAACVLLGQAGGISTDAQGNGNAALDFPATLGPEDWAGLVLIARTIGTATTYEYVGAIHVSINTAAQPHFDLQGQLSSIVAATASFVIIPFKESIVTDTSTKFKGKIHSFSDLLVGMQVEVKGVSLPDGTLLATNVSAH